MHRRPRLRTAVLASVASAACLVPSAAAHANTQASTPEPAASAVPTADVALPEGMKWAEVSSLRLRFAVPEGFDIVDPAILKDIPEDQLPDAVGAIAEASGMTARQFIESMAGRVLLLAINSRQTPFATNVNVIPLTADVSEAELRAQFASAGATVVSVAPVTTPFASGLDVTYTTLQGGTTLFGRSLVLGGTDNGVFITLTSATESEAAALATSVLATASSSAGDGDLPAGMRWAESAEEKVRFAVPLDFAVVDPSTALGATGSSVPIPGNLAEVARAAGMTVAQFLEQVGRQMTLLAIGQPVGGFTNNVSLIVMPAAQTEEQIRADIANLGATVVASEPVTTAFGSGTVMSYTLPQGAVTVHGRIISLAGARNAALITVSATNDLDADALAKVVVDTVSATS